MTDPLARLVGELSRLPGIGPKTATRLAHFLLKVPVEEAQALAQAIIEVKEKLFHCSSCNSITAVDPCRYCSDPRRDRAGGPEFELELRAAGRRRAGHAR